MLSEPSGKNHAKYHVIMVSLVQHGSVFDFSEMMLNVSFWAAKITVFYFCSEAQHKLVMLVTSINQLITKAISAFNIPTFYKVVVQW